MKKSIVMLVALLLVQPCAYAVDGVVLINQSTVLAAGGFPYTIKQSGSYRLSGPLTTPDINTSAIVITADNVTLDLNGFSIVGPAVCGGIPVSCSSTGTVIAVDGGSSRGTAVLNGVIQGMGNTVISLGDGGRIEKMRIIGNVGGISIGHAGVVTDNTVMFNLTGGIGVTGATVTGNTVAFNRLTGISATCPSALIGNTLYFNETGIFTSGAGCTLANNAP
jgi:hypothetical protein